MTFKILEAILNLHSNASFEKIPNQIVLSCHCPSSNQGIFPFTKQARFEIAS